MCVLKYSSIYLVLLFLFCVYQCECRDFHAGLNNGSPEKSWKDEHLITAVTKLQKDVQDLDRKRKSNFNRRGQVETHPQSAPMPLYLTKDQYTMVKGTRHKINVTNIPEKAVGLRIWTMHDDLIMIKNETHRFESRNSFHIYWIPEMDIDKGENIMYATMWTDDGVHCGTKPIFIIKENSKEEFQKAGLKRNPVDTTWIKACSKVSCVIQLDWANTCEKVSSRHNAVEARTKRQFNILSILEQVPVYFESFANNIKEVLGFKDQKRHNNTGLKVASGNKFATVGYRSIFTCNTTSKGKLEWYQRYGNGTTMLKIPDVDPREYGMDMGIEEFDNNTYIICDSSSVGQANMAPIMVHAKNNTAKIAPEMLQKVYYNGQTEFHCDKNVQNLRLMLVALTVEYQIKLFENLTLTAKDNGSTTFCIYFVQDENSHTIKRLVSNKTLLIYKEREQLNKEKKIKQVINTTEFNKHTGDKEKSYAVFYYIGVACVVGILLLLIILFVKKNRSVKKAKIVPVVKESNIMNSNQVLYAELELYALPAAGRIPNKEESPYVAIVPQMIYADLDVSSLPQGQTVNHEESPYAQIQASDAQPARLQVEDTPYAQIVKGEAKK